MWRWIGAFALLFLGGPAIAGGPSQFVQSYYEPSVDSTMGRINFCGILFGWAITYENKLYFVKGSLNASYLKDRMLGVLFKTTVNELRNEKEVPRKVRFANIRVGLNSSNSFRPINSDNPNAFILIADMQTDGGESIELVNNFIDHGGTFAFNIDGSRDFTFTVPAPNDMKLTAQYAECASAAIQQLKRELEAK